MIEKRGPFTVTDRKILHDKFDMRLVADDVTRPDGTETQYFWVDFPRESVQIYPLDTDGNIYLNREFHYPISQTSLDAAGGSPHEGESLEDAAKREVREELGLVVDNLQKVGEYQSITSRVNNKTHVFIGEVVGMQEASPEAGEITKLEKMPFEEAMEKVRSGEINTATVAAALWHINDLATR